MHPITAAPCTLLLQMPRPRLSKKGNIIAKGDWLLLRRLLKRCRGWGNDQEPDLPWSEPTFVCRRIVPFKTTQDQALPIEDGDRGHHGTRAENRFWFR